MADTESYSGNGLKPQTKRVRDKKVLKEFLDELGEPRTDQVERAMEKDEAYLVITMERIGDYSAPNRSPFLHNDALCMEGTYHVMYDNGEEIEPIQSGNVSYTAPALEAYRPSKIVKEEYDLQEIPGETDEIITEEKVVSVQATD